MSADEIKAATDVMQTVATLVLAAMIWRLQNEVRGVKSPAKGEK